MERKLLIALALVLIPGSALCQNSQSPLGDPPPAPIQDPRAPTHHYTPASVTAGAADAGPTGAASAKNGACNNANPCAMATPARDRVAAVKPGP
jgi:hypothetical protein